MREPAIRAVDLAKSLGASVLFQHITFELYPGRVMAIMGRNGAGKSSLLKVLAGIWSFQSGQLWRLGQAVPPDQAPDSRVGLLAHQSFLYGHLTLEENLRFYGRLWRVERVHERAAEAMDHVGLSWVARDQVRTFSRGMVQRASLARLLVTDPDLWLLDEPFSGLDGEGRQRLVQVVSDQRSRGKAVLMTTHRIDEALDTADALAILKGGRFIWWGGAEEMRRGLWQEACRVHLGARAEHA